MTEKRVSKGTGVFAGVLILGAIATVFLIQNFGHTGASATWPAIVIAMGVSLALAGYLELGLGVTGVFIIWLLANLRIIPEVGRSWPFFLLVVAIMVIIGFLRARSSRTSAS